MADNFLSTVSTATISQRQNVAHALREAIISGDLAPGTQLKQNDISAKFNCSPGPVREAMRDLESEGLLEHYPNRGVFVSRISNREFLEMLAPTRLVLEKFALRDSVEKFTPIVIADLEEQIEIMKEGAKRKDSKVIHEADIRFHSITMELAATPQTLQLWKSVMSRIRLEFYRVGASPTLASQATHHKRLLEVLLSGDKKAIDRELEWHIIDTVVARLKK